MVALIVLGGGSGLRLSIGKCFGIRSYPLDLTIRSKPLSSGLCSVLDPRVSTTVRYRRFKSLATVPFVYGLLDAEDKHSHVVDEPGQEHQCRCTEAKIFVLLRISPFTKFGARGRV